MTEGPARARVLVVDDNEFHREFARDALAGYADVSCSRSADEALEVLERQEVDLVISDLTMPGLSGLDLLRRVRRDHADVDFVLVTAHASVDTAVEALRVGATDYLQKPVRASDLILLVERALSRRGILAENARLRTERAVFESCKRLAACLEPEDVFSAGLDLLMRALRRDRGLALYRRSALLGSDGFHARGFPEGDEAALRDILVRRKCVDFARIEASECLDRGPFHDALREAGQRVGQILAVPARGEDRECGVFCILDDDAPFAPDDLARANIVGGHATIALQNSERYHRARERAFVDDVTEIYNARYLLEAMDREIRRAERYGSELSILFLDLDRFKLVNDRFGHLAGSDTLRQLSQVLGQCVRQVDTLARYGGDEFTILLVDSGEDMALQVSERIRRSVAVHPFEAGSEAPLHVTCSIGVATYPQHGRTREALLDAADKAMYRAKSKGRDLVCSASELG